jgi:hypothetical protein
VGWGWGGGRGVGGVWGVHKPPHHVVLCTPFWLLAFGSTAPLPPLIPHGQCLLLGLDSTRPRIRQPPECVQSGGWYDSRATTTLCLCSREALTRGAGTIESVTRHQLIPYTGRADDAGTAGTPCARFRQCTSSHTVLRKFRWSCDAPRTLRSPTGPTQPGCTQYPV